VGADQHKAEGVQVLDLLAPLVSFSVRSTHGRDARPHGRDNAPPARKVQYECREPIRLL
jgi:hypothetical protein